MSHDDPIATYDLPPLWCALSLVLICAMSAALCGGWLESPCFVDAIDGPRACVR